MNRSEDSFSSRETTTTVLPLPSLHIKVIQAGIGGLLGIFILHPYTMVVYRILLTPEPLIGLDNVLAVIGHSFAIHMWPMSLSYFLFGAVLGYLVGTLWEKKRNLLIQAAEIRQRNATHELLKEITRTGAHYVRNANVLIGALARRIIDKPVSDQERQASLEKIQIASTEIEAVIAALISIDMPIEKEEIGATHLRMLNIRAAVAQKLQQLNLETR